MAFAQAQGMMQEIQRDRSALRVTIKGSHRTAAQMWSASVPQGGSMYSWISRQIAVTVTM